MRLAADLIDRVVVLYNVAQIYGRHNTVALGVHADAVDLINIENSDIKRILFGDVDARSLHDALSDRVVLQLERTVNATVLVVEIYAAEMTEQTRDSAYKIAVEIGLDQRGGEGIVYVFVGGVKCDALNMPRVPLAAVNSARKINIV